MRFLPQWLAQIIGDAQFDAAVDRIAGRIETPLWNRIVSNDNAMSNFEARGYIRARSMILVSEQIARDTPPSTPERHLKRLKSAVMNRLMDNMTSRLANYSPAPALRRAA